MGKIDTEAKKFFRDKSKFADLFNKAIYHGRNVISEDALRDLDSKEFLQDNKGTTTQTDRDTLMLLEAKEANGTCYLLLGVENQAHVHYAMPARCMAYDASRYSSQLQDIKSRHQREKEASTEVKPSISKEEYLSGFYKTDTLIPVITLVVFLSAKEWDGPRTLHEMFSSYPKEVLARVPDYRMNLLVPAELSDDEIDEFTTDLREVIQYIKYSSDKRRLAKAIYTNERYCRVDAQAVEVINVVTNSKIKIEEGEEVVNMCKALNDMFEDVRMETEEKVRKETEERAFLNTLQNMSEAGGFTLHQMMSVTKRGRDDVVRGLEHQNLPVPN